MSVRLALLIVSLTVAGCGMFQTKPAKAEPVCITVVSPFVEDPIIIPPSLSDNVQLCAPKAGVYGVTPECVSLALVRRYLYANAAQRAER